MQLNTNDQTCLIWNRTDFGFLNLPLFIGANGLSLGRPNLVGKSPTIPIQSRTVAPFDGGHIPLEA